MIEKRISHAGLSAYRVVRGQTLRDVELTAAAQEAVWAERWNRRVSAEKARDLRQKTLDKKFQSAIQSGASKVFALERTKEIELEREGLERTLLDALDRDPNPSWDAKQDRSVYSKQRPTPPPLQFPSAVPDPDAPKFNPMFVAPNLSVLDRLIPSRRKEKERAAAVAHEAAKAAAAVSLKAAQDVWDSTAALIRVANDAAGKIHKESVVRWESDRDQYLADRDARNKSIDDQRDRYLAKHEGAVSDYIEDVLSKSEYPDAFPKENSFEYSAPTGTLVVDYELPNQTALPLIKEVKFVASRSEFQEVLVSETWVKKAYDDLLYQIALRTLHELYASDEANALVSVVFNGWVRSTDRSTGTEVHACVMSLEARKDEFLAINLRQVDCKACFKKLKGVSASKLIELSPVKPLVTLNKEDRRFVEGYTVVDGIDERTNLAAMDWLDFENLIREVFEKEFSKNGGEVKITQASRDGGVDAVAFDPDPIRGGKLVIQAKRYTNTVGVSAVRDLHGTVHHEGANKGILVTTSDFGPDAYAFARDKPLTLISGGELLYLLEQHGHKAKIDIAEAKRIAAES